MSLSFMSRQRYLGNIGNMLRDAPSYTSNMQNVQNASASLERMKSILNVGSQSNSGKNLLTGISTTRRSYLVANQTAPLVQTTSQPKTYLSSIIPSTENLQSVGSTSTRQAAATNASVTKNITAFPDISKKMTNARSILGATSQQALSPIRWLKF